MESLADLQESIEQRGLTEGERRYTQRVARCYERDAASHAAPVRHLLGCCVEWLIAELQCLLDEQAEKPGRRPAWMIWTERVYVPTIAYLTLKVALNGVGVVEGITLRHAAMTLARMLVDEHRAQIFRDTDEGAFANAMNHAQGKTWGSLSVRVRDRMAHHKIPAPLMPQSTELLLIGSQLLAIMIGATGLFTLDRVPSGRARWLTLKLVPTPDTLAWITKRHDRLRLVSPLHPPLVIPPKDWAQGVIGGYHYGLAESLPFVRHASPTQLDQIAREPLPLVYSAINALQRTAWRVNARVLRVVESALDGRLLNVLPGPTDDPLPDKPEGVLDREHPLMIQWRRHAAEIHSNNERRFSRRMDAQRCYAVAVQNEHHAAIYYPYTLDFRGRAYPAVEYFNPHGPDIVRGMLEFADGVALSKVGAGWLAVCGANALGSFRGRKLTKLTFQERVDTIKEITPEILKVADDPHSNQFWTEADDPWQFLAFAFEWTEWTTTNQLISHLPVSLDGTCNGLQHYSAILRDGTGSTLVNLSNSERPQDIYQEVADQVLTKLQSVWASDPVSALWMQSNLVTRSLFKRPVMTLPYGATKYGFVTQLLETLRNDEESWKTAIATFRPHKITIRKAVQHLSKILYESLESTVGGALQAMDWLQESVRQVARETKGPIGWSVPMTGFPVRQEYWKGKYSQIKTLMQGKLVQPSVTTATSTPKWTKITNSIAPNVVHSADAACMMLTTVACAARGIPAFSMIHDSYAVHAEYVPVLADAIRTSFIAFYHERDWLTELKVGWERDGSLELLPPPMPGTFDINDVRHSTYFFS